LPESAVPLLMGSFCKKADSERLPVNKLFCRELQTTNIISARERQVRKDHSSEGRTEHTGFGLAIIGEEREPYKVEILPRLASVEGMEPFR